MLLVISKVVVNVVILLIIRVSISTVLSPSLLLNVLPHLCAQAFSRVTLLDTFRAAFEAVLRHVGCIAAVTTIARTCGEAELPAGFYN